MTDKIDTSRNLVEGIDTLIPRRIDAKMDADGHCTVCGLEIREYHGGTDEEALVAHICPPGFRGKPCSPPMSKPQIDTSTAAVNRLANILDHGDDDDCAAANMLRALAAERDAAKSLREKAEKLLAYLDSQHKRIINEPCPTDEKHCACVPALKMEIERLEDQLATANRERERLREALKLLLEVTKDLPNEIANEGEGNVETWQSEELRGVIGQAKATLSGEGKS